MFIGLGIMSLLMARNIPLFAIASAPILSVKVNKFLSKHKTWQQINERFAGFGATSTLSVWPIAMAIIAFVYLVVFNLKFERTYYQFDPAVFPVGAVEFLKENPQKGNMFNEFNWGGYLEYQLFPDYKVFLDSQSDFYGEPLMREYDQITTAQSDWMNLFDKYHVEWVIIPLDTHLKQTLRDKLNWKIIYQDNTAAIFRVP